VATLAAGDLVNFVEEDDAQSLDAIDCHARDLVHVDRALFFFLDQILEGLVDLHLPLFACAGRRCWQACP
jgi:hypothetical protein